MTGDSYQARLASEQAIYRDCLEVHSLPPIFHYWSDRYVRPKLEQFGFSKPDDAFLLYLDRACGRADGTQQSFVSIGAGNCDLEIRLARTLVDRGRTGFTIECLDLNPAMLARGEQAARMASVQPYLSFTAADFNNWQPTQAYEAVIANQSLHHVSNLETLFARVRDCLAPGASFVISDMIGRNGHLRWPEALEIVQEFWRKLPPTYRINHKLQRYEEWFQDWDCSGEGFEGVRSQDVLPLLLDTFHFETFIGFANAIDPFVDRSFGVNFDPTNAWDRAFIDAVHAADEAAMASGRIKPTHMVAAVGNNPTAAPRYAGNLSPRFSVRVPLPDPAPGVPGFPDDATPYAWESFPHGPEQELRALASAFKTAWERVSWLEAWGNKLDAEAHASRAWALSLERDCVERTAWAQRLDNELSDAQMRAERLEIESRTRGEWGQRLETQLKETTEWALGLERERAEAIAIFEKLESELADRTRWARQLDADLEERTAWALSLKREIKCYETGLPGLVYRFQQAYQHRAMALKSWLASVLGATKGR